MELTFFSQALKCWRFIGPRRISPDLSMTYPIKCIDNLEYKCGFCSSSQFGPLDQTCQDQSGRVGTLQDMQMVVVSHFQSNPSSFLPPFTSLLLLQFFTAFGFQYRTQHLYRQTKALPTSCKQAAAPPLQVHRHCTKFLPIECTSDVISPSQLSSNSLPLSNRTGHTVSSAPFQN